MNRFLAVIVSLALAMPASALAKEAVAAKVCGKTQCHESKDKSAIAPLTEGGPPTKPPDGEAPWYSATLTIGGEGREHPQFTVSVVPSLGLIRGENGRGGFTWMTMLPDQRSAYVALTAGLAPQPAGTLEGVHHAPPAATTTGHASDDADAPVWPWILAGGFLLSAAGLAVRRWNTA
jgi:hypothetical protein